MKGPSAGAVAVLIFVSTFVAAGASPAHAVTPGVPVGLSVRIVPTIIPADGGTYPAVYILPVDSGGNPTLAVANVTVYLTSSTPTIGSTVNSTVVISAGRGYAMAVFKSTPTVGSTDITASAAGYAAGKATVLTALPRGYPTTISVSAVPSSVNSTSTSSRSGTLIVEFLDPAGFPAKAIADTPVTLYSSSATILTLNATSFTMKAGALVKVLSFVTKPVPGVTTLTASAPQLNSGTAQVTVLGRPPLSLKLYVEPAGLLTSSSGQLVIALTDLHGNPARAPSTMVVQIRSSNTAAVSGPTTATIPAGSISASITLTAGASPGSATITASSSGLNSAFVTITTYNARGPPTALKLYVGPSPVLADNGVYKTGVVTLLNGTGFPTVGASLFDVTLASSQNSSVGSFAQTDVLIPSGGNYIALPPFQSTFVAGATSLTVSTQNLLPDTGTLSTFGPTASKIAVSPLFPSVPADGSPHPELQLSLEDSLGAPAVATKDVTVYLSSLQTAIVQVSSTVTIGAGQSAVVVPVTTTSVSGTANLTAYTYISSGYTASSTLVKTVTPSPSAIGAYLAPSTLAPSPYQPGAALFLQLQDSAGNPSKARQPTTLTLTSSNTAVFNKTLQVQIPQGVSYAEVPIVPLQPGSTTFTIVSPGLTTATAQFTAMASPFSAMITASALTIFTNQTATLTVTMTIDGQGISGVSVAWSSTGGIISPSTSNTDSNGQATAVFRPMIAGVGTVNATASSSWAGTIGLSTKIILAPKPQAPSRSLLGTPLSFPYVLALAGGVAAAVVVAFLLIRRRRRAGGAEESLSEEESAFNFIRPRVPPRLRTTIGPLAQGPPVSPGAFVLG